MVSQGTGSSSGSDDQTRGMPGKSGEKTEQVKEAASQVKEQAGQMTDQVKEQANKVTDKAKEQATTRADDQKERAAQGIVGFADALNQVSGSMREQNPTVANFAETAAGKLEQFAGTLNDKDVNQLMSDVEQMARKQPTLFVGGAFLAGVFAARFLKSSSGMSTGSSNFQGGYRQSGYGSYDRRYSQGAGDYDTRGFSSQYNSQYGRPTGGSSYGSTYGSTSGTSGYGTTRGGTQTGYQTGTTRGGMTTGTTGGQDTPGATRTGSGDIDAAGRGIGTTGSTTSGTAGRSTTGTTGTTGSTTDRAKDTGDSSSS
jgi:uncharacterized protein YjbJ (UPF0337 family)